jgi:hypothetical protein
VVRRAARRRYAAALRALAVRLRHLGWYAGSVWVIGRHVAVRRRLAAADADALFELGLALDDLRLWRSVGTWDHSGAYRAALEAVEVWRVDADRHWMELAFALVNAAECAARLERYDDAVHLARDALDRFRRREHELEGGYAGTVMALDVLAQAYRATGREAAAREAEQESAARWPRDRDQPRDREG